MFLWYKNKFFILLVASIKLDSIITSKNAIYSAIFSIQFVYLERTLVEPSIIVCLVIYGIKHNIVHPPPKNCAVDDVCFAVCVFVLKAYTSVYMRARDGRYQITRRLPLRHGELQGQQPIRSHPYHYRKILLDCTRESHPTRYTIIITIVRFCRSLLLLSSSPYRHIAIRSTRTPLEHL